MARRIFILFIIILIIILVVFAVGRRVRQRRQEVAPQPTPPISVPSGFSQETLFNSGLKLMDFNFHNSATNKDEIITAAVWYPTDAEPQSFVYHDAEDYQSIVALNAPVSKKSAPYPLIIFSHGGYGSGYNAAYFMEYLGRQGYIVVAPDYIDTKPPDYTQQIAFSRIKTGNAGNPLQILRIVGQFAKDMNNDREFFLSYLAEHRLNHTSFVISKMIELNKDSESIFYQSIKEDAIGISGHSLGGVTILGKIGAHPDKEFEDNRIRAALIFSGGVYPFENNIGSIDIPIIIMAGNNDEPMNPTVPRRVLYDKVKPPKFYLVLKDATHFVFGNSGCGKNPLYQAVEIVPQTSAIARYGAAFFNRYLKNDLSASEQLNKTDPALAYYIKEEKSGEASEWGKEPTPGKGGPGGILKEIIKRRFQ